MPSEYYDDNTINSRTNYKKDENSGGGILSKFSTLTNKSNNNNKGKQQTLPTINNSQNNQENIQKEKEEDEIEQVEKLGKDAIDSCLILPQPDLRNLEDGQSLRTLTIESKDDPKVQEIHRLLIYWLNEELAQDRIVVRNLQEDIFDGQVIQKLIEKLAQIKIEVPEVSQSEEGQRQKLRIIVDALSKLLNNNEYNKQKWTAELIHSKDIIAILHL
ncbi:hypothetical protein Mgra_00010301 [Meloidogyne graminicola]|uniref:Calponin-homology (CH) domain-containing protein n=1 Tax=Meloidogyne graminicola TaxID=189291 RepID=A0A8S9Z764_9BILA|nr:hypothetical protein Mgra_00010301 [Meloidogyne graminicola]